MTDNVIAPGRWGGRLTSRTIETANLHAADARRRNRPVWIVSIWVEGSCQYFATWYHKELAAEYAETMRKVYRENKALAFVKVELLTPELLERYSH
jgi:hypothetical protein